MPRSYACSIHAIDCLRSVEVPYVSQLPRAISETLSPLFPSLRYSMGVPPPKLIVRVLHGSGNILTKWSSLFWQDRGMYDTLVTRISNVFIWLDNIHRR